MFRHLATEGHRAVVFLKGADFDGSLLAGSRRVTRSRTHYLQRSLMTAPSRSAAHDRGAGCRNRIRILRRSGSGGVIDEREDRFCRMFSWSCDIFGRAPNDAAEIALQ